MRGEVTVAGGGTITVENCRLSIAQGAVLRGSVSIGRNGERTMDGIHLDCVGDRGRE